MFALNQLSTSVNPVQAAPSRWNPHHLPCERTSTLADLCTLLNITVKLENQPRGLRFAHRRIRAGDYLHHQGAAFQALYILTYGFIKTVVTELDSAEQVVGFSMRAALLGMDGIAYGCHQSSAIALTDTEVIELPLQVIRQLDGLCPGLSRGLYSVMSHELALAYPVGSRLGLTTRGRLGRLLLNLADRFAAMGYSSSTFNLPMGRADIASYLGMAQETVSRGLMELESAGLIRINRRAIQILDREGLRALKRCSRSHSPTYQ